MTGQEKEESFGVLLLRTPWPVGGSSTRIRLGSIPDGAGTMVFFVVVYIGVLGRGDRPIVERQVL